VVVFDIVTLAAVSAGLNKKYVTNQLTAAAAASATAQEVLAGIRTVKSFAKEQHIINT
jgi:ABC-type bacteriocin/lantibiotic exporter with double-glycine peptidase domain